MSNRTKDNVLPVNTFRAIMNRQFAFLLLHHMPIPQFVCCSCKRMDAKKLMNVHEALEYLENLDASSEDDFSDNEDFISRGRQVILPPNNEGSYLLQNNLNRSQLLAGATVDLSASNAIFCQVLGINRKQQFLQLMYLQGGIKNQR